MIDVSTPSIKWALPKTSFNTTLHLRYKLVGGSLQTRTANIATSIIGAGFTYVIPAGWNGSSSAFPTSSQQVGNLTRLITVWIQNQNASLAVAGAKVSTDHLGRLTLSADYLAKNVAGAVELIEITIPASNAVAYLGFPAAMSYLTIEATTVTPSPYSASNASQVHGAWYSGCTATLDTWDHQRYFYSEHQMRSGRVSRVPKSSFATTVRYVKFDMVHAARIHKSRLRSSMVSTSGLVPDTLFGAGTLEHLADRLIQESSSTWMAPIGLRGKVFLDGEFDSTRPTSSQSSLGGCHHFLGPYDIKMMSFDPGADRQNVQDMAVEFYPVEFEFTKTGWL